MTYVNSYLNGEKIVATFYEKELQITNQKEFRIGKVIKRKGDKLYAKRKDYVSSSNSWIDKKWVHTFLNDMNHLEETLISKLIRLVMQQKLI